MSHSFFVSLVLLFVTCCNYCSSTNQKDQAILFNTPSIEKNITNNKKTLDKTFYGLLNTLTEYTEWAAKEEKIVNLLRNRLQLIEAETRLIKNYINCYYEFTGKAIGRLRNFRNSDKLKATNFATVPVHRMLRRYAEDFKSLKQLLNEFKHIPSTPNITDVLELKEKNSTSVSENKAWVKSKEYFMSMESFIHIQEVNEYTPDIIYQCFDNNDFEVTMKSVQCAEMGAFALYRKVYYGSVEWLQFAFSLAMDGNDTTDNNIQNDLVVFLLKTSIQEHNRVLKKLEILDDFHVMVSLYTKPIPQPRISRRKLLSLTMSGVGVKSIPDAQFMDLCQGNVPQTPDMQKNLKCYFEQTRHPYLYINPVKAEQLSESPPIIQFYEMIGNKTTQEIHKVYNKMMKPSGVYSNFSKMEDLSKLRTSVGTSINFEDTPDSIFHLADMITGLKVWHKTDRVQYVEYTYGRFYTVHKDHLSGKTDGFEIETKGERLATILYYLEVPEKGGQTPFCEAGVSARPVKGSAVFWYNLHKNGTVRNDVNHGSCPVLQGNKIIMNHWVRQFVNWQNYKCSLNQNE